MIADFRCKDTKALFDFGFDRFQALKAVDHETSYQALDNDMTIGGMTPRRFSSFASVALRKLDMLDAAKCLEDLRIPPANRLEQLKGDRAGQHSIRINAQWRICFIWANGAAHRVEIVDYH